MKKTENKIKRLIFSLIVVSLGGVLYSIANYIGSVRGARNIETRLDSLIPFVPELIYVYLFVFFGLLLVLAYAPIKYKDFFRVVVSYSVLVFVSFAIFAIFPTTMGRPEVKEGGSIGALFVLVRIFDGPNNLFPSLHVSSSVFAGLAIGYFRPKLRIFALLLAILVAVSTLLVKQHVLFDVFGGAFFGWLVFILILKRA